MIVLDANVLIAHLDYTDALHERATDLLLDLADRQLGASPMTLADVLMGPAGPSAPRSPSSCWTSWGSIRSP